MWVGGHSRSSKPYTIRKLECNFLFAFHSNYGARPILYRLQDIATSWSKIAKFLYPTCI